MKLRNKKYYPYILFAAVYLAVASILVFGTYLLHNHLQETPMGFLDYYRQFTTMWDVKHYITIAKDGYTATGDDRFLLVFFPFYPLCIRLLHMVTTLDYVYCASLISIVCAYLAMVMFYQLMRLDYSKEKACYCTLFLVFYPFSFFLFTRMSEALFLFLLFSDIWLLRKEKYLAAGVVGCMLSMTRLPGLAVGVIMLTETILQLCKDRKAKTFAWRKYLLSAAMMLLTLSGFLFYLWINYKLHKNPFAFFGLQEENWFQHAENPVYVVQMIVRQQLQNRETGFIIGVGIANLISMAVVFFSGLYACLRFRLSYGIYTLVYFYVCYSASWLLSGPRYSMGAFPVFMIPGLFAAKHKKTGTVILLLLLFVMIFFSEIYINGNMY